MEIESHYTYNHNCHRHTELVELLSKEHFGSLIGKCFFGEKNAAHLFVFNGLSELWFDFNASALRQ